MRRFPKNETMAQGMKRPILKNHPGKRIQKMGYGTLERVLLALIAACLLVAMALSIQW